MNWWLIFALLIAGYWCGGRKAVFLIIFVIALALGFQELASFQQRIFEKVQYTIHKGEQLIEGKSQ